MPKGIHDSKRGPAPANPDLPRNPANIDKAYVRGGVNLTAPSGKLEDNAINWWQDLGPDGRLAMLVRLYALAKYGPDDLQEVFNLQKGTNDEESKHAR